MTELIERALAEDVGDGDATTEATVDAGARGHVRKPPATRAHLFIRELRVWLRGERQQPGRQLRQAALVFFLFAQ